MLQSEQGESLFAISSGLALKAATAGFRRERNISNKGRMEAIEAGILWACLIARFDCWTSMGSDGEYEKFGLASVGWMPSFDEFPGEGYSVESWTGGEDVGLLSGKDSGRIPRLAVVGYVVGCEQSLAGLTTVFD